MTVAGLSIAYAAYTALSDVTSSDKLTVGMWTQLKDNFMNHETRIGTLETGKEVSATFLAGPSNMATVTANNGGYVLFDSVAQNSDPSVFEVITTGSYGIRFKKAGRIVWNYQQDARTSSNVGYVQAYAYIDGSDVVRSLMGPTNTLWDGMHNHGVYNVAA